MNTIDEALEVIAQVLIRCTIMGILILLFWWGALKCCGDLVYRCHSSIAPMTRHQFELIHYFGMLMTKAGVSLLFFFPFAGVKLVQRRRNKGGRNQG